MADQVHSPQETLSNLLAAEKMEIEIIKFYQSFLDLGSLERLPLKLRQKFADNFNDLINDSQRHRHWVEELIKQQSV